MYRAADVPRNVVVEGLRRCVVGSHPTAETTARPSEGATSTASSSAGWRQWKRFRRPGQPGERLARFWELKELVAQARAEPACNTSLSRCASTR